ncbi:MAG: cytidylate kinase-like family protein [Gemmataceae bacterium]|nr:cytidylate kinase-like family protein [Gemmataceae bacterium]
MTLPDEAEPTNPEPPEGPLHGYAGDRGESAAATLPLAPSIAISREAGARGTAIARRIGERCGWLVCDREMLGYTAQDPSAVSSLLAELPLETTRWIDEQLERLQRGGLATLDADDEPVARLILALAAKGEVVFVGRGAGYLLPRESTLHVQLIAPLDDRVAYLSQLLRLTFEEAQREVATRDAQRRDYIQRRFRPGDAPTAFDLILNSSALGSETCVELILAAMMAKSNARFQESW